MCVGVCICECVCLCVSVLCVPVYECINGVEGKGLIDFLEIYSNRESFSHKS